VYSTFHTHTIWCDGKNTVEEMIVGAIEKGFDAIGFSSHAMFPVFENYTLGPAAAPAYVADIRAAAAKYAKHIKVFCALEADYIPGVTAPEKARYASLGLDYLIGSLHWVDGVAVDHTPEILADGIRDRFGGSARALITAYHERLREMVSRFDFDILGHADLYRKYNLKHPYFDESEPWYREELVKSADTIAASGKLVEVNTGAIGRGWRDDAYPSDEFRALLRARGVKFVLNSDSHSVETLDAGFDKYATAESYVDFPPLTSQLLNSSTSQLSL